MSRRRDHRWIWADRSRRQPRVDEERQSEATGPGAGGERNRRAALLKHATLPAEQQAAYTDPPLPIESQAVEEITAFLITEIGNAARRPHPAKGTDVNRRPGSSTTTLINISQSGNTVQKMVLKREMRIGADDYSRAGLLHVCIVLSAFATHCAPVLRGTLTCEGVQVLSDQLTVAQAEEYCRYAVRERKKVEGYWGDTWKEPIRINVSSSYRISRALVPGYFGNRGFMEMPLRGMRDNIGPLLHEIVHIYAPNNNRFLAEGLAVYLHTKLGGNPAFPNFGEDLHRSAVRSLSRVKSLEALDGVRTPRPLSSVMDEETAYVLAGSFVEFLIETYNLPAFRSLYETDNYEKVYGKSLNVLETEWRLSIQGK